ncbi:hypothetical protein [Williamsia soli]|uniref:hypothetical protein n=1 Tax=Williamsia soli TaxID=364929 RepID=UPI001A9F3DA3|nr:hypothetical protein [Williamsia soli]
MNAFQETSELFESLHEARLRAVQAQRAATLHGVADHARVALGRVVVALEIAEDACREAHAVTGPTPDRDMLPERPLYSAE